MSFPDVDPVVAGIDLDDNTLTVGLRVAVDPGGIADGQSIQVPAALTLRSLDVAADANGLRGARALAAPVALVACEAAGPVQTCPVPSLTGTVTVTFVFEIGNLDEFALTWSGGATMDWRIPVPDRSVTVAADAAISPLPAGVATEVTLNITPAVGNAALRAISVPRTTAGYLISGCDDGAANAELLTCAVTGGGSSYRTPALTVTPRQPESTDAGLTIDYGPRSQIVPLPVIPLELTVPDHDLLAGAGTTLTVTAGWDTDVAVPAPSAISIDPSSLSAGVTVVCEQADRASGCPVRATPDSSVYTAGLTINAPEELTRTQPLKVTTDVGGRPVVLTQPLTVITPTVTILSADDEPPTIPAGLTGDITVTGEWDTTQPVLPPDTLRFSLPATSNGLMTAVAADCSVAGDRVRCPPTNRTATTLSRTFTVRAGPDTGGDIALDAAFAGARTSRNITVAPSSVRIDVPESPTAGGYGEVVIGGGWTDLPAVPLTAGTVTVPRVVDGVRLVATDRGCITADGNLTCPVKRLGEIGSQYGTTIGVAPVSQAASVSVPITVRDAAGVVTSGERSLTIASRVVGDPVTLAGATGAGITGAALGTSCLGGGDPDPSKPTACLSVPANATIIWARLTWTSPDKAPVGDVTLTSGGTAIFTSAGADDVALPGPVPLTTRSRSVDAAALESSFSDTDDPAVRSATVRVGATGQAGGWSLVVAWNIPGRTEVPVLVDDTSEHLLDGELLEVPARTAAFLFDFDPRRASKLNWINSKRASPDAPYEYEGQFESAAGARVLFKTHDSRISQCVTRAQCDQVTAPQGGLVVGPRILPPGSVAATRATGAPPR